MHSQFLSTSVSLLAAAGLLDTAYAAALPRLYKSSEPAKKASHIPSMPSLPHFDDGSFTKRDAKSAFQLRNSESFYYGHSVTNPMANVTGTFPGEHEHVISMDRFAGMLEKVDCKNPDLMMDFKTKEGFEYAKESWTWVNDKHENHFIMVTNYDGCGPKDERAPFQVTDVTYDEVNYKVHLKATELQWIEAFPHWSVNVNTGGLVPKNTLQARWDVDKEFTTDVSTDFSGDFDTGDIAGYSLAMGCNPCTTSGEFDFVATAEGSTFPPSVDNFLLSVVPKGVSLDMTLHLGGSGKLTTLYQKEFDLFTFPLGPGIHVPFVEIGPAAVVKAGLHIGDLSGEGEVSYGAKVSIADGSSLNLDFGDETDDTDSGFNLDFESHDPTATGGLSMAAEIYAGLALEFDCTIASKGIKGGILVKLPDINGEIKLGEDSEGICDGENKANGLAFELDLGVDLAFTAEAFGKTISKDLFTTGTPLYTTCVPFGSNPTTTPPSNGTVARRAMAGLPRAAAALPTPAPVARFY